ncbi:MAG: hypothetical protein AAFR51_07110 [Pseudomonadota bacterium]
MSLKIATGLSALILLGACATSVPYGPADRDGAKGYTVLPIENNRFRISYTDTSVDIARSRALRRAAETTLEKGDDWFQIVTAYSDSGELAGGGSSVSIGGSSGSSGRSSFGVGVGISLPLGGGSSGPVTHVLEIVTGPGAKPDNPDAYDASDVMLNLSGA